MPACCLVAFLQPGTVECNYTSIKNDLLHYLHAHAFLHGPGLVCCVVLPKHQAVDGTEAKNIEKVPTRITWYNQHQSLKLYFYQETLDTQLASKDCSSMPLWSIGLNLRVRGNGTLVVTNPEKCQLIHPPTTTMGTMLVKFPLSISVIMLGSVIGFGGAVCLFVPALRRPDSSLLR